MSHIHMRRQLLYIRWRGGKMLLHKQKGMLVVQGVAVFLILLNKLTTSLVVILSKALNMFENGEVRV